MDPTRFDKLAKSLAGGVSRRTVLRGLAGALAGAAGLTRAAEAAPCAHPGQACTTDADCCGALPCVAGVCQPPGQSGGNGPGNGNGNGNGTGTGNQGCAAGLTRCGGACVALGSDVNNCGGCGVVCAAPANAAATCTNGTCGYACNAGLRDCGNGSCQQCCGAPDCPGTECAPATCSAGQCGTAPLGQGQPCGTGATCSNGTAKAQDTCDGNGNCVPGATTTCGNGCSGDTCAPLQGNGATCSDGGQCQSGFCVGGVCCATACDGTCQTCDGGTCGTAGDLTSCGDGVVCCSGACVSLASPSNCGYCWHTCPAGEQCAGGTGGACYCTQIGNSYVPCQPGDTCCNGTCSNLQTDAQNCGTCGNACGTDETCSGGQCVVKQNQANGATCTANGQCQSGYCAQGYCCDSACDADQCHACNVAGQEGTCVSVCGPYACGGTTCLASCSSDSQCAAGYYCGGGQCGTQKPLGGSCLANDVCQSGYCVGGHCCESACTDQCYNCNAQGACVPYPYYCAVPGGTIGSGLCCNGACTDLSTDDNNCGACGHACGAGEVCNSGACQAGCIIGGTFYASGASNPASQCQSCQPDKSTTSWSYASGSCSINGSHGVCCENDGGCCDSIDCTCCNGYTCPGSCNCNE